MKDIFQAYRNYWWVVLAVFVVGSLIGFFFPGKLQVDIAVTEFSLPVVIREQTSTNWKEEDTYALIGFVNAWLNHEWTQLSRQTFPDATANVILRKDTYYFSLEQNGKGPDPDAVNLLATELFSSFITAFIEDSGNVEIHKVENAACLTDAGRQTMVSCIPLTDGIESWIKKDVFDLGAFLWVGELSSVQTVQKFNHLRYLQTIAGGLCAIMTLALYFLVDLTRKYAKVN